MNGQVSQEFVVGSGYAGMRLDVFLARHFVPATPCTERLSRSEIQRMVGDGQITVNGVSAKPSARLRSRDSIRVLSKPPRDTTIHPEPLPLDILHEDADCIVINKAPGLTVHPGAGHWSGTLVNALLHRWPRLEGIGGVRRPGIVHRLDKDTSGVMIVAKNAPAYQHLALQFQNRTIEKMYVALAWGRIDGDQGRIDRPIGRHRLDRKRMSTRTGLNRSRTALTEWRVAERFQLGGDIRRLHVTFLKLRPHTGRTHQLRVHLADFGHPLVGDPIYGGAKRISGSAFPGSPAPQSLVNFNRQALHAQKLTIAHPRSGERIDFTAPLPADLTMLLEDLRKYAGAL